MVTQTVRFTLITKPELKAVAEEVARETNTSRNKVISQCLEELARRRRGALMTKYYKDMSVEHRQFAKKATKIIQRVASSWGD